MKMRKQRLMGLAMLAITALILVMARGGKTPEDSDATAALLTGPLGLYMLLSKTYILYEDKEPKEATEASRSGEGNSPGIYQQAQKGRSLHMARKRVVEPSGVKTWEDANDALRQIAEAQLAVQDIEGEMNKQILGAKKAAEEQSKPHKDRIAKLERELKDFVTEHRADMGKTKTRALTFGEVGFRLSTSVSLPRAKEKIEEIIRRLKNRQMMDCIVVKEDVSKEALKKYGEDTVNAVGATWKQQDVFGYELDFAKLEQVKSGM